MAQKLSTQRMIGLIDLDLEFGLLTMLASNSSFTMVESHCQILISHRVNFVKIRHSYLRCTSTPLVHNKYSQLQINLKLSISGMGYDIVISQSFISGTLMLSVLLRMAHHPNKSQSIVVPWTYGEHGKGCLTSGGLQSQLTTYSIYVLRYYGHQIKVGGPH